MEVGTAEKAGPDAADFKRVHMTCRYCGLETGAGASHCSQTECIAALNAEIERAKRLIGQGRETTGNHRHPGASNAPARSEGAYTEPA